MLCCKSTSGGVLASNVSSKSMMPSLLKSPPAIDVIFAVPETESISGAPPPGPEIEPA